MSLQEQELLDVMAYVDGELEPEQVAAVEALLARDAEARELVASMLALGDGVRAAHSVPTIDITLAVMAKATPNELDRARLKAQSRNRALGMFATVAALAAGAWFYSQRGPLEEPPRASLDEPAPVMTPATALVASASPTPLAANELRGVQVNSLDTSKSVSVFYVSPSEDNAAASSSVVVWIDEPTVGAQ